MSGVTKVFNSLEQFSAFAMKQAAIVPLLQATLAEEGANILHRKAHAIYGDSSKLADLAPATQDERTRLGYSANDPLLRDGTLLRDKLEKAHGIDFSAIGTDEQIALYHELGTDKMPARPVLQIALHEAEPEIAELIMGFAGAVLGATFGAHHLPTNLTRTFNIRRTP